MGLFHAGECHALPCAGRQYAPFPVPVGRFPLGDSIRAERPFQVGPLPRKAPLPVPRPAVRNGWTCVPLMRLCLVCPLPLAQRSRQMRRGRVVFARRATRASPNTIGRSVRVFGGCALPFGFPLKQPLTCPALTTVARRSLPHCLPRCLRAAGALLCVHLPCGQPGSAIREIYGIRRRHSVRACAKTVVGNIGTRYLFL